MRGARGVCTLPKTVVYFALRCLGTEFLGGEVSDGLFGKKTLLCCRK